MFACFSMRRLITSTIGSCKANTKKGSVFECILQLHICVILSYNMTCMAKNDAAVP